MSQLQPLQSRFFMVNGYTFEAIGTLSTGERDDCIDILKNLKTGKTYYVKRSHTTSQNILWLKESDALKSRA